MKSLGTANMIAAGLGLMLITNAFSTTMLWFGNSYTEAGKQWAMLPNLINCTANCGTSQPSGMNISITTELVPSCWLSCHEGNGAFSKIDQGHYALVFAQDNVANWLWRDWQYGTNLADKNAQVVNWSNHAKGAGGKLVFEQMWIALGVPDHIDETQTRSDKWYDSITTATNSILVPSGHAWYAAYAERPSLQYIDPDWNDGCHPGKFGAYLNICCQYAAITGKSPVGATWRKVSMKDTMTLTDDEALFAQQKAWEAYQFFKAPTRAIRHAAPAFVKHTTQPAGETATVLFDMKGRMVGGTLSPLHGGREAGAVLLARMNNGKITKRLF
jgi:hypothetical protein